MSEKKIKIETLCPACRLPLPTVRVTEKRLSRTLIYPVLDDAKIVTVQGRGHHKECAK